MNFDEWLESVGFLSETKLDKLIKLVRAQRQYIDWLCYASNANEHTILAEMAALEAALMEQGK